MQSAQIRKAAFAQFEYVAAFPRGKRKWGQRFFLRISGLRPNAAIRKN
jgi:hypothetical protein